MKNDTFQVTKVSKLIRSKEINTNCKVMTYKYFNQNKFKSFEIIAEIINSVIIGAHFQPRIL